MEISSYDTIIYQIYHQTVSEEYFTINQFFEIKYLNIRDLVTI